MKAVIYKKYGPPSVLQLTELDTPTPRKGQLLIQVKATAVNSADVRLRKADPFLVRLAFGLFKPQKQVLGMAFSGVVQQLGEGVTSYQVGDEVFGLSEKELGTYAEYLCLPEIAEIAVKPSTLSHEQAAVIPFGGHTALHFFKQVAIKPGQKVLIYGASGAVGTAAVMLAKHYGAEVTGVCSTANCDMVAELGADHVIDRTKTDLNSIADKYDVVMETVGKVPLKELEKLTKDTGSIILVAGMIEAMFGAMFSKRKVLVGSAEATADDIAFLADLVTNGEFKPVIDRKYGLDEIVGAHTYVDKGHKKGNVAIVI